MQNSPVFIRLADSLKMKGTAAPFLGSDVCSGFGEVPPVTVKVLSIVLALTIGLIQGLTQDDGTVPPCALAVTSSIFDTNLNDVRMVGHYAAFSDGKAAFAGLHLDAVIWRCGDGWRSQKSLTANRLLHRGRDK